MFNPNTSSNEAPHAHTEIAVQAEDAVRKATETRTAVVRLCGKDLEGSANYLMLLSATILGEKVNTMSSWQEVLAAVAVELGVPALTKEYFEAQNIATPTDLDILMIDGMGDPVILDLKNKAIDMVTKDQTLSQVATILISH